MQKFHRKLTLRTAAALHGDKDQTDREKIMFAFKSGNLPILVATDVASRGLDVKGIKNVVNFEVGFVFFGFWVRRAEISALLVVVRRKFFEKLQQLKNLLFYELYSLWKD